MSNVIYLDTKLHRFYGVIRRALEMKQPIIVGTSNAPDRMRELQRQFPEAMIEIVEIGVKVSCRK
jgi:hypothetical protein